MHDTASKTLRSAEDDHDTVAALVRMLIDSGFAPNKLAPSLTKSAEPSEKAIIARCINELAGPSSGRRKVA